VVGKRNIWVVDFSNNNVLKVNAALDTLTESYPVGPGPDSVAFDGSSVWVANRDAGNLTRIRSVK
jgi:DNA-binding beta-propeller fold protein YncE